MLRVISKLNPVYKIRYTSSSVITTTTTNSNTSNTSNTMVQFNQPSTSAIAAFSAFYNPVPIKAFQFAHPSATSTRINTRTTRNYATVSQPLFAAVMDEANTDANANANAETQTQTQKSPKPSNHLDPRISASADFYSFVSAPNGRSGIMAIKLREEDYIATAMAAAAAGNVQVQAQAEIPKSIGMPMPSIKEPSSTPGMFGSTASASASASTSMSIDTPTLKPKQNKSSQGEDFIGKAVVFEDGRTGTIIAQRPPMAFVICDFSSYEADEIPHDLAISILGRRTTIPVSDALFGSIIDCYGNPIATPASSARNDNSIESDEDTVDRAIFAPIPKVSDIALINSPVLTGTAMVDALAPIGKGQNMLVIGQDTGVGQRDLVVGAVKTQVLTKGAKCVYAITSQCKKEREGVIQMLRDAGVLDDIVVVSARDRVETGDDEALKAADAAEAITVAAAACSIGEALALARGDDTLVIIDDIDQHKVFWDWTTRVLIDKYGLDSVVKDDREGGASSEMRGFYSSLIQRAGRFNKKNKGGSMTLALLTNLEGQFGGEEDDGVTVFTPEDFAQSSEKVKDRIGILVNKNIPLTSENLRKIQIPLPSASDSEKKRRFALQHTDDLISMSDGQVWLDEALYSKGQRPAMDAQRSVTRIGIGADTKSRADAPAMRGLAGGLRFDFAQADSLEGAGANSGADKQIVKKNAYLLAMHQAGGQERSLSDNCVALLAASMRVLDDTVRDGGGAGTEKGESAIKGLLDHVKEAAPTALADIDSSLDLSEAGRTELESVIKGYFA